MSKICFGCGAILQSDDKDKKGYVIKEKLNDAVYCERCYKMMHYGINTIVDTPKDIKEIIRKVNNDNKFVIFLTDYLNLSNEVVNIFNSITKNKLFVLNKIELLPKGTNKEKIINYLRSNYKITSDIKLKGSKSNTHGVKNIYRYLMDNDIHEAYILGVSNSGKSTFINDLSCELESNLSKINTNKKENTTLDFIRVKLNDNLTLIDSPGFILNNKLTNEVSNKVIKSYNINTKDNDIISFLDGKFYIRFLNSTPVILYTNYDSKKQVKKYYKDIKLDNKININKYSDIVIYGIGFITIKNNTIIETNLDNKYIEVRPSIYGGKNE